MFVFVAFTIGIRCEPFAAAACPNPEHICHTAQADVHFKITQAVGDPRGPESTLYWARGFRQPLDSQSQRIFDEAKDRPRGAAPPGARYAEQQAAGAAAASSSGP